MSHLVALLLNPKSDNKSHTKTEQNVALAAKVLGVESYEIANLSLEPTKDGTDLNKRAGLKDVWSPARLSIQEALSRADSVLAGWGVQQFTGEGRRGFSNQKSWVVSELTRLNIQQVVTIDDFPRHPSRWRMYLGPQRGIYLGGTFEDRLKLALTSTPISALK